MIIKKILFIAKKQVTEENLSPLMPLTMTVAILMAQVPETQEHKKALKNFKEYYKGFAHTLSTSNLPHYINTLSINDDKFKEKLKHFFNLTLHVAPIIAKAKSFKGIEHTYKTLSATYLKKLKKRHQV